MRKIIAGLIVSVDGFIEGPNGELDWVETWEDPFNLLPQIDTCIQVDPGTEEPQTGGCPTRRLPLRCVWKSGLGHPRGIEVG
jgi:hypothetical protein